jgi:N-methylhydantoinase A
MTVGRLIGIDVGGTFTDILCVGADRSTRSFKFASDSAGLRHFLSTEMPPAAGDELRYGTTTALNALLTGRVPSTGLIVTAGFRDLLETARLPASTRQQSSTDLPAHLIPLEWVREVKARMSSDGAVRTSLEAGAVARIARDYAAAGIETVAVALLHSHRNPAHERAVAEIFTRVAPDVTVVLSSDVLPELREYERALATALNACLIPELRAHLSELQSLSPQPDRICLMQSNGRVVDIADALAQPLGTALGGPAAAVVGARALAAELGIADAITLDVGGTSTEVALLRDADFRLTTARKVAGFPLRFPMIDVLSIGAGGGSIARAASDRRWHVGPDSVGADPGPACYGRGGKLPTLTDAHLVLGRLPPHLLGGQIILDAAAALTAMADLGRGRALDAYAAAGGVLRIATHEMCGAVRRIAAERGVDPRTHPLIALGGAGPLHAAELAELLGMCSVLIPPQPGLAAAGWRWHLRRCPGWRGWPTRDVRSCRWSNAT